jgi:hypothetical protein
MIPEQNASYTHKMLRDHETPPGLDAAELSYSPIIGGAADLLVEGPGCGAREPGDHESD